MGYLPRKLLHFSCQALKTFAALLQSLVLSSARRTRRARRSPLQWRSSCRLNLAISATYFP